MSTSFSPTTTVFETPAARIADMKLEILVLPVSDVDRAKQFYSNLGWRLDLDFVANDHFRVIQFTPPGSSCSIIFGKGITAAAPGSAQGLYLIVSDLEATRADLIKRGVEVSELFHDAGGVFHHLGDECRVSGAHPQRKSYATYASFKDPDGNGWFFQEVTLRLPGHVEPADVEFTSAIELTRALRRAAAAHSVYERTTGESSSDSLGWYAEYIVREQAGKALPT